MIAPGEQSPTPHGIRPSAAPASEVPMTAPHPEIELAPHGNHSGQWGLASILLSCLAILFFPMLVLLLFAGMFGAYEDPFVESRDMDLGVTAAYVLLAGFWIIALFALVCGVVGLVTSRYRKQPVGLSLAGTVCSAVAVFFGVMLLLTTVRSAEWVRSLQKTRYGPNGIPQPTPSQMRR
jgi:hypothetical protein